MDRKRLPLRWAKGDIVVREAAIEDKNRLNEICDSWEQKAKFEGEAFAPDYIENCIFGRDDLPPIESASVKNYAFRVIGNTKGQTVGFMNFYHGYPDECCLWIGMFVIDKEYWNQHYGSKAMDSLIGIAKENGWGRLGLGVYLKNWQGLRFWVNQGFQEIGGVYGDREFSDTAFSLISLYRNI